MAYDFDLIVIGGGSGGVRAARMAAGFGARVALVEVGDLGGTCVNVGCVPKKLFVYGAHFHDVAADAKGYGWTFEPPTFDWNTLRDNKTAEIERLNGIYGRLLDNAGVTTLHGYGTVAGPNTVTVGEVSYTAERILIATGGTPRRPDFPGADLGVVSDAMFSLPELPEHAIIVGGGYIAVEFAGILHGLGVKVCLLERGERVLRGFDRDIGLTLGAEMRAAGIEVHMDTSVVAIEAVDGKRVVRTNSGRSLPADLVLYAIGRVPNADGMGLEDVGVVRAASGRIEVDDQYQTSVPSIFAVGDVSCVEQLTPVALNQGMAFARRFYGGLPDASVNMNLIPTAVFSTPNVGTVGLTERAARDLHDDVVIYRSTFRPMFHTMTGRQTKTMMKIVVDGATDKVLGMHMVGPDAGEIIQGFAAAMTAGVTKTQLDQTIGIHPTAAEEFVTMRTPVKS